MLALILAASGDDRILAILVQLGAIIAAARAGGWILGRLGQPQVVGEIAAGVLLGPSFFGRLAPGVFERLFPAESAPVLQMLGQLGLMFLMFLVGMDFDFSHLRRLGHAAVGVAVAGIVLPFAAGAALAWTMHPHVAPNVHLAGFMLFMGTALSITAIPILGRILVDFGISRTRLGTLTISAAAVDDALGWILLAAVSTIVVGGFDLLLVLQMLGWTAGFVASVLLLVRPLLIAWSRRALRAGNGNLSLTPFSMLVLAIIASAIATSKIGIFAVFGPFVLGAVLSDQEEFRHAVSLRCREFVTAFFLPVFFTYTGIRTDISLLDSGVLWLFCALVTLTSVVAKVAGCGAAAWWAGLSLRESTCVGVLMNTRALMGLVAIHVGRDLGVIPDSVFSMLVIMALVTTFMTSPLLRRLLPGPGLEPSPEAAASVARGASEQVAAMTGEALTVVEPGGEPSA